MVLKRVIYPLPNSIMTMFTQWLSNYHESVKGYFEMLLRAMTRRWSVSPDMIELTHRFPWRPFWASKLASIPGDTIGGETPRCGLLPRISPGIGQMWRRSGLESRWGVSGILASFYRPREIRVTGTGTPAETVLEEVERKVISQSGPTAGEDADDSNPVVEQITVPLERWDVYSHLRALCSNDPRFSIWGNVKTDEDLENVTIWHRP